ncbi:biotin synthase BioB [Tuwongella immobilis]|uniref:Biotin synthase n=1 Tax=Tuwongella immobilis TaxID=692036 RepID=A0A6C2YUB0_9BACT|nr:biotin synthase BioB [Tuwongella immobilis]VIP04505.1 biotin synthase : Biotin synthase OS=planctomycete KSU-1 GN=bioB PE=3 SV=1: Radical_SAM: BATS [Tuwongella immobilis]VTS06372.1 biotin synthase : Biotin synthase OS=planctomycete KSU-1 GN=bioB PE=3 SV=1: Radical_SAM: BATS [Tuwongella immobilis]
MPVDPIDPIAISRRILAGGEITREETHALLSLPCDGEEIYDLFYAAHKVRRHFHGNRVTFCSIVASKFGKCSEDCKFCAQSAHYDTNITSHEMMSKEQVKSACTDARNRGASSFGIVNSGRGPNKKEWPKILEAIEGMKEVDGIGHCATLGELTPEQARDLKAAGIARVNHNLETSKEFYSQIVKTHTWQDRVRTLKIARDAGLELCTGCIFGMGESIEDRVSVAFSLKEINPHVVPINFLNPIPGTPLEHAPKLRPLQILQITAVMRLVLPRTDLKVAGGREKNLRDLQSWIFYVGGTSAIIGNYLATMGRTNDEDMRMVQDLELTWTSEVGNADETKPFEFGTLPGFESMQQLESRITSLPLV